MLSIYELEERLLWQWIVLHEAVQYPFELKWATFNLLIHPFYAVDEGPGCINECHCQELLLYWKWDKI